MSAIKNKEWHLLYSCKGDEFKQIVSYETFAKSMSREAQTFSLRSYEVIGHRLDQKKFVVVKFSFAVEDPITKKLVFHMLDEQIWERHESGELTCYDLGMSMLLPFNGPIVP